GEFVGLRSGKRTGAQVSDAARGVPAGVKDPPGLSVSHVLREGGNRAVIHLEALQFSPGVPVAPTTLYFQPVPAPGQIARIRLSRKEVGILPVKIRTGVSRTADSKALANGVTEHPG